MDNIPFDQIDRLELAPYEGQQVCFIGTVTNTAAPTPDKTYACLGNVTVTERNDEMPWSDRTQMKFQHIWLDISEIKRFKTRITDFVIGSGTVVKYTRKDGTQSFCIRFQEKGFTEVGLMESFKENMDRIREASPYMTVAEQHEKIRDLFRKTEEVVHSGKVCFFKHSVSSFLQAMRTYRGQIMRAAGVVLPNNRRGRRCNGEYRRNKRQHTAPARGFA